MTETNEQFDEMLNEVYPEYKIGDLTFSPAQILRTCDPVAYRIYANDYDDEREQND